MSFQYLGQVRAHQREEVTKPILFKYLSTACPRQGVTTLSLFLFLFRFCGGCVHTTEWKQTPWCHILHDHVYSIPSHSHVMNQRTWALVSLHPHLHNKNSFPHAQHVIKSDDCLKRFFSKFFWCRWLSRKMSWYDNRNLWYSHQDLITLAFGFDHPTV